MYPINTVSKPKMLILIAILILGLILRLHNYSRYPQRGASSDEYTYSFLGISLLTKGIPISWSAFPAYKNLRHLTIKKLYFPIVYPYFDHPPLNGLLVGGWSLLLGEDTFEAIDLSTIRLVPIFLSIISSILIFLIGFYLYNYKTAIWAILIYSTTTIFAMNGRVVFAENLLTPLMLLTVYLFLMFKKNMTLNKTVLLGILCGLSFWTKEVGITVFLTTFYFFISERLKPKYVFTLSATSLLIIFSYALYGAYYDQELFWQIISLQSNREIGPKTLLYLLSTPIIVNKIYLDGWYFFGLISFFLSFWAYKSNKFILVPSLIYVLLLIFSLTEEGEMGWYMIPMFPFMALFSARLLLTSLQKNNWFVFVMLLFVGLLHVRLLYQANFGLTAFQFRTIMLLMFVPFIFLYLIRKEKAFNVLAQVWFYLYIIGNVILTYNYIHPA